MVARPARRRTAVLRRTGLVGVAAAIIATGMVVAADSPAAVDGGATASEVAERRLPEITDVVTIYDSGPLDAVTRDRAVAAARLGGSNWSVVESVSSAMTRVSRNGATVQAAPSGYSIPMSTTFLTDDTIATLMGAEVLAGLNSSTLVMSTSTATRRGAQAGDVVTLRHVAGGTRDFTISQVVDDGITGGTELLMLPGAADRLGVERESSVLIWGFANRDAIMSALAAAGVVQSSSVGPGAIYDPPGSPAPIRLRRSWDPFDPDDTLGMSQVKQALGEFAYQVNPGSVWVTVDGAWRAANLPSARRDIGIGIRAQCHLTIEPALRAALAQVAARGLWGALDVNHANLAGGCFAPRFNRLAPDSNVGFLSRHAWGGAIDINTVNDCQGCTPPSLAWRSGGCETVRIFREHGFSWGGNYTTPDGMHFEYVGQDRSRIPYPSRWCPNDTSGSLTEELPFEWTERSVLFADSGLLEGHAHG